MRFSKAVYQGTTEVLNHNGLPLNVLEVAERIERSYDSLRERIPRLPQLPERDLVVLWSHFIEREIALEAESEIHG